MKCSGLSSMVAHEGDGEQRRHRLPGGVEVALLGLVGGDLAVQQLAAAPGVVAHVLGVGDVAKALADHLVGGVAGDVAQRLVDEHPAPVLIK